MSRPPSGGTSTNPLSGAVLSNAQADAFPKLCLPTSSNMSAFAGPSSSLPSPSFTSSDPSVSHVSMGRPLSSSALTASTDTGLSSQRTFCTDLQSSLSSRPSTSRSTISVPDGLELPIHNRQLSASSSSSSSTLASTHVNTAATTRLTPFEGASLAGTAAAAATAGATTRAVALSRPHSGSSSLVVSSKSSPASSTSITAVMGSSGLERPTSIPSPQFGSSLGPDQRDRDLRDRVERVAQDTRAKSSEVDVFMAKIGKLKASMTASAVVATPSPSPFLSSSSSSSSSSSLHSAGHPSRPPTPLSLSLPELPPMPTLRTTSWTTSSTSLASSTLAPLPSVPPSASLEGSIPSAGPTIPQPFLAQLPDTQASRASLSASTVAVTPLASSIFSAPSAPFVSSAQPSARPMDLDMPDTVSSLLFPSSSSSLPVSSPLLSAAGTMTALPAVPHSLPTDGSGGGSSHAHEESADEPRLDPSGGFAYLPNNHALIGSGGADAGAGAQTIAVAAVIDDLRSYHPTLQRRSLSQAQTQHAGAGQGTRGSFVDRSSSFSRRSAVTDAVTFADDADNSERSVSRLSQAHSAHKPQSQNNVVAGTPGSSCAFPYVASGTGTALDNGARTRQSSQQQQQQQFPYSSTYHHPPVPPSHPHYSSASQFPPAAASFDVDIADPYSRSVSRNSGHYSEGATDAIATSTSTLASLNHPTGQHFLHQQQQRGRPSSGGPPGPMRKGKEILPGFGQMPLLMEQQQQQLHRRSLSHPRSHQEGDDVASVLGGADSGVEYPDQQWAIKTARSTLSPSPSSSIASTTHSLPPAPALLSDAAAGTAGTTPPFTTAATSTVAPTSTSTSTSSSRPARRSTQLLQGNVRNMMASAPTPDATTAVAKGSAPVSSSVTVITTMGQEHTSDKSHDTGSSSSTSPALLTPSSLSSSLFESRRAATLSSPSAAPSALALSSAATAAPASATTNASASASSTNALVIDEAVAARLFRDVDSNVPSHSSFCAPGAELHLLLFGFKLKVIRHFFSTPRIYAEVLRLHASRAHCAHDRWEAAMALASTHSDCIVTTALQDAVAHSAGSFTSTAAFAVKHQDEHNGGNGVVLTSSSDCPLKPFYLLTSSSFAPPVPALSVPRLEADDVWERVYVQTVFSDISANATATFPEIRIPSRYLCECELDRPILIRVLSHRGSSAPEPVGQSRTTLRRLLQWPKKALMSPPTQYRSSLSTASSSSSSSSSTAAAAASLLPVSGARGSSSSLQAMRTSARSGVALYDHEAYSALIEDHGQMLRLTGTADAKTGGNLQVCRAQLLVPIFPEPSDLVSQLMRLRKGSDANAKGVSSTLGSPGAVDAPLTFLSFVSSYPRLPRPGIVVTARVSASLVFGAWKCKPYFEIYALVKDAHTHAQHGQDHGSLRLSGAEQCEAEAKSARKSASAGGVTGISSKASGALTQANSASNSSSSSSSSSASSVPWGSPRRASLDIALEEGGGLTRNLHQLQQQAQRLVEGKVPAGRGSGSGSGADVSGPTSAGVGDVASLYDDGMMVPTTEWRPANKTMEYEGKTWSLAYRSEVANAGASTTEPTWTPVNFNLDNVCKGRTQRAILLCVYHKSGATNNGDEEGTLIGRAYISLRRLLPPPKESKKKTLTKHASSASTTTAAAPASTSSLSGTASVSRPGFSLPTSLHRVSFPLIDPALESDPRYKDSGIFVFEGLRVFSPAYLGPSLDLAKAAVL